jgi:hypothetical protein
MTDSHSVSHWPDLGVSVPSYPSPHPFGNTVLCKEVMFRKKNYVEICQKQYEEMSGVKVAIYSTRNYRLCLQYQCKCKYPHSD